MKDLEILINWIVKNEEMQSLKVDEIFEKEILKLDNSLDNKELIRARINNIKKIVKIFSKKPWLTQEQVSKNLNLDRSELIKLNSIIARSDLFQKLILKYGTAKKYWNSIIPFASLTEKTLNNEYAFPKRIALFPGVSCMFYCGFCGRNQKEKYPLNIIDESMEMYKKLFLTSSNKTSFSISGGLEPLTNPRLGDLIEYAHKSNIRMPIITNGYSLTENYVNKNEGIWKADSLRISLYGIDANSYEFITRIKKGFEQVKKNTINFLKRRNQINKKLKFGFNFIVIPENLEQLTVIPKLIGEINDNVTNGPGVEFLTLRDDYQSVTNHSEHKDVERKYRLEKPMDIDQRKKLIEEINKFENLKEKICPELYVDYGYSLESVSKGNLDLGLIKNSGKQMRKFGFTQMSVAIDLFGDVFFFREAGFLNREGNKKMIIGRISKEITLDNVIKEFLEKNNPLNFEDDDSRFMDSFDHVLTSLVNQAESDNKFKIPFDLGPVRVRSQNVEMQLGNNWYSEKI